MAKVLPLLAALALLAPRASRADSGTESRLRDALRQATAQLHAAEDERAAAQAREAALTKELEEARAQAKAAAGSRSSEREVADLKRRLSEQAAASAKLTQELAQCQAAAREGADATQTKEAERARATEEAESLKERLLAAQVKNDHMYRVGKEIIDWLNRQGVGAALAAREPFLGYKRVALENEAQDYLDKLDDERIVSTHQHP